MKTIIVWYRNDLRIHDHPALSLAAADGDVIVPVFIANNDILSGNQSSPNRNRFLMECLKDLRKSLQALGADLLFREGDAVSELRKLAKESDASNIYYTADYTPLALARDKHSKHELEKDNIVFRALPGRLAVSGLDKLHTKAGTPHKVFTPFFNNWLQIQRRELATLPTKLSFPSQIKTSTIPMLSDRASNGTLSPDVLIGGETAARKRLQDFIKHDIKNYKQASNDMAADQTSRLSAYLHFGCLSPREIETMLPSNQGADAWHRQLAWREFYHYIIYKFPKNKVQPFQERYHSMKWDSNQTLLDAWKAGRTGYPVVDAAMRQLLQEGWIHNRGRLIVGSFLTKDLWLSWQDGEAHFMQMLIDGDTANNNGNWQWIASVGVDPAPVFRRLYNPSSQQKNYDLSGAYVRKYVPELKAVPDKYLIEPWTMPEELQHKVNCVIGTDYPAPIIDHKAARIKALDNYRAH